MFFEGGSVALTVFILDVGGSPGHVSVSATSYIFQNLNMAKLQVWIMFVSKLNIFKRRMSLYP